MTVRRLLPVTAGIALAAAVLSGCATDPLLGDQARVGAVTVTLTPGAHCTQPGDGCLAPLLEAAPQDSVQLGIAGSVELSATVLPALDPALTPAPVVSEGQWTLPLSGMPAGTYLVTLLPPGEVRQLQLRVS